MSAATMPLSWLGNSSCWLQRSIVFGFSILVGKLALRIYRSNVCTCCLEQGHIMKTCPKWIKIRQQCTTDISVMSQLSVVNERGCCAAGVFIYEISPWMGVVGPTEVGGCPISSNYMTHIYVIQEKRDGQLKYNFPGGKRQSPEESPFAMARRELMEETGYEYLLSNNVNSVLWYGPGKYALYPIQFKDIRLYHCCDKCTSEGTSGLIKLEISKIRKDDFHSFAYEMLEAILRAGGFRSSDAIESNRPTVHSVTGTAGM